MEYFENIGEKVGLANVDLDNIKKQASFFFRDKFKSARLLLTDVTASQLLAEESTNDDDWGPATKTMADISDACRRSEDYPRIMQVLHARLALVGKKHWRQFLKTLTVVEYLLFHGPEQVLMEFSSDRDLIEDLTRFNYVDERGVDHGVVVRKKAKQVLKLLMEDDYLKEERSKAQKLSKSIFGQGSYQSSGGGSGASRYGGFGNTSTSSSASEGLMFDTDIDDYHMDKKFTAFEERILSEKRGTRQDKSRNGKGESTNSEWRAFEDDSASLTSAETATDSNWADFSNLSPGRSAKLNGSSSIAGTNDLLDEETSAAWSPQASTSTSIAKASARSPLTTSKISVEEAKKEEAKASAPLPTKSKMKVSNYVPVTSSGKFKLPPPPPPPGGSKYPVAKSRLSQPAQPVPDLLDLSFDIAGSIDSASVREEKPPSFDNPTKVPESDQAVMDFVGMNGSTTSMPSSLEFLSDHTTDDNGVYTKRTESTQAVTGLFDPNHQTTKNDFDAFASLGDPDPAIELGGVSKGEGSRGAIPDFFDLNEPFSTSVLDLSGTGVQSPDMSGNRVFSADEISLGEGPSSSTNVSGLGDQFFLSERSGTGATGLPEVVPDVFDAIAPDFASFGVRDTEKEPAAKPADGFFNLLS